MLGSLRHADPICWANGHNCMLHGHPIGGIATPHDVLHCHCLAPPGVAAALPVYRLPAGPTWLRSCGDITPPRVPMAAYGARLSMHSITRLALPFSAEGSARVVHLPPDAMSGWCFPLSPPPHFSMVVDETTRRSSSALTAYCTLPTQCAQGLASSARGGETQVTTSRSRWPRQIGSMSRK